MPPFPSLTRKAAVTGDTANECEPLWDELLLWKLSEDAEASLSWHTLWKQGEDIKGNKKEP